MMKKILIKIMAVLFLGLLITGCENWEQYDSISVASAPSVTVNTSSVMDSSITVTIQSTTDGYVSFLITNDTSMTVEDGESVLVGNAGGMEDQLVEVKASQAVEYTFESGLVQNTWYKLFAVSTNPDGVVSAVKSALVKTDDSYSPTLEDVSPSRSSSASQSNDFSVELTFSEPVQVADASKISFSYYYDDEVIAVQPDEVSVDGNVVTVMQTKTPYYGEYVFLSWEEGAITDFLAGTPNKAAAWTSGVIEGELSGLYWRVEFDSFDLATGMVMPDINSGQVDLDSIMLKFNNEVAIALDEDGEAVYAYGDMQLVVTTDDVESKYKVPLSAISIEDSVVKVYVSDVVTLNAGEVLSIEFIEGIFEDMYGNPSAAYPADGEESIWWLKSYGYERNLIAGTYVANCTSYWGGDTTYTVNIFEQESSVDTVYIVGLVGSTDSIKAVFDGILGTIVIDEQIITLPGDTKTYAVSNGFNAPSYANTGSILTNGDMVVTWGIYNYTDGGWWDLYPESSWIKQ